MKGRIKKIKNLLNKLSLNAIIVSSYPNIVYLTGYSGFSETERECLLLVTARKNLIFTDGRYSEAVRKEIKEFELIEVPARNFIKDSARDFFDKYKVSELGIEENDLRVIEYEHLKKTKKEIVGINLDGLRGVKEKTEIASIKKACGIGGLAFSYILSEIKKGVTEKEISFKIELFMKSRGADISFKPIVAFGKNSAIPHHQSSGYKLRNDEIVLLDFGAKADNYCSDMSRTLFFGKASLKFKKMYSAVSEAQKKAIEFLEKTNKAKGVDKVAREFIMSMDFPPIPHSLGHGIGIEVHESPFISPSSKDELADGMVFSIEPGIYLPGFGGIRIEDLVYLHNGKPDLITHSSTDIIEL